MKLPKTRKNNGGEPNCPKGADHRKMSTVMPIPNGMMAIKRGSKLIMLMLSESKNDELAEA